MHVTPGSFELDLEAKGREETLGHRVVRQFPLRLMLGVMLWLLSSAR